MSVVPTAAAQLAVWAEPARRTHCQRRHVPTARGCPDTAGQRGCFLPRRATGRRRGPSHHEHRHSWAELSSGLSGSRALGLYLPFCPCESYRCEGRTRGTSREEPNPRPQSVMHRRRARCSDACGDAWSTAGCSARWRRHSTSTEIPLPPAGESRSGTRRPTALTVLAATAGVAGRAEAGSRGGVAAGVVGTLRTNLLTAQSPATLRAGWRAGRERTHKHRDHSRGARGTFLSSGARQWVPCLAHVRAKQGLLFGNMWLLTRTTLLCLFYKQREPW